jgi:hypothetical protein
MRLGRALMMILCLAVVACASNSGIDGTYVISSITCNGVDETLHQPANPGPLVATPFAPLGAVMVINDTGGSFAQQISNGCLVTLPERYAYPTATTISLALTGIATCKPANCNLQICGQQQMQSTPTTFTYASNGNTLTLTNPKDGADNDCTANGQPQPEVITADLLNR